MFDSNEDNNGGCGKTAPKKQSRSAAKADTTALFLVNLVVNKNKYRDDYGMEKRNVKLKIDETVAEYFVVLFYQLMEESFRTVKLDKAKM
jgi:hypothetical protein